MQPPLTKHQVAQIKCQGILFLIERKADHHTIKKGLNLNDGTKTAGLL